MPADRSSNQVLQRFLIAWRAALAARTGRAANGLRRNARLLLSRMTHRPQRFALATLVWGAAAALGGLCAIGCGVGGSNGVAYILFGSARLPGALTINAGAAAITVTATTEENCGVTGSQACYNPIPASNWRFSNCSIAAGTNPCGTIAAGGSSVVNYTPPAGVAATATVTLTADTADGPAIGVITILPPLSVSVLPGAMNFQPGQGAQTFTATVTNDPDQQGVSWTLTAAGATTSCAPTCGTLGSLTATTAVYTPPATLPAAPDDAPTLTAVSVADGTKSGTALITLSSTTQISVAVAPHTATAQVGLAPVAFSATVTNSTGSAAVTWTLSGAGCSAAACGTLSAASSASGATITYTPPTAPPVPNTVTLKATAAAGGAATDSALITVLGPIGVTVAPTTASAPIGSAAQPFSATLTNDTNNQGVTWALTASGALCAPACGSLSKITAASVSYTPPATVPTAPNNAPTLTATAVADPTQSATAAITIPAISVAVSPPTASVQAEAGSQSFTATVTNDGTNKGVLWSLSSAGSVCTAAAKPCGTVAATSASGVPVTYTPPATVPSSPAVTLTATAAADPTKAGAAAITLTAPPTITISLTPTTATVAAGASLPFSATVSNTPNTGINWTVSGAGCSGPACGTVAPASSVSGASVSYTAPPTAPSPNTVTLTAASAADSTSTRTAQITIGGAVVSRYLLEVNGDGTISSYATVPTTGQLRSVTYLSLGNSFGPVVAATLHPNGNVLYAVQPLSLVQQLLAFSVSAGGTLSALGSPAAVPGPNYDQLVADPLGRFLWALDTVNHQIVPYPLDPTTGALGTPQAATSVAAVSQIAVDPAGLYLFTRDNSGNIGAYTVGSNAALTAFGTPPSSHPMGTGAMQVAPSGLYLYALDDNFSLGAFYGYAIAATGLTSVNGSPFLINNGGGVDIQFAIDPSSSFLYAVDTASPTQPIDAYAIGAGGVLTPLSETLPGPATGNAARVSIDPSGTFLYLAYGSAHEVWTYRIAQSGASRGTLTAASRTRFRGSSVSAQLLTTGTAAVTFTPTALYVTNSISQSVAQFSIAPSTGALTSLGAPFTGGSGAAIGSHPEGIAVLPSASMLYVGNFGDSSLDLFSVTADGSLASSGRQPVIAAGETPAALAIDPSGAFLYIADQLGGDIGELPILAGGALGTSATVTSSVSGSAPVYVATDPTGRFLYTADSGTNAVGQYAISLGSGALTAIAPAIGASGAGPAWVAIDPSGRFLYSANKTTLTGGTVGEFLVDAFSGSLAVGSPPYIPAGTAPSAAVVEPSGQYLFVADASLNQIFSYLIDPSTGALANNATSPVATTGSGPTALGVDISGQYLYCVNASSNDIDVFKINLGNGTLTRVGTGTVPTGGTTPVGLAITGTTQ